LAIVDLPQLQHTLLPQRKYDPRWFNGFILSLEVICKRLGVVPVFAYEFGVFSLENIVSNGLVLSRSVIIESGTSFLPFLAVCSADLSVLPVDLRSQVIALELHPDFGN
jgi:hypothetical protein